jgi:stage IV sporulation protein FB
MSWRDSQDYGDSNPMRDYGKPGGDWQGLRPTFDNPLTWSVRLGRVFNIDVRLHVFFLIYIVIELLSAVFPAVGRVTAGIEIVAISMLCLFGLVLLHEFGHCIACRWIGGDANEILMWPLGGLAFTRPPNHWRAHMVTAVGGPLVNVVICLVTGVTLGLMTGQWLGVALPNPLSFAGIRTEAIAGSWPLMILFLINTLSLVLLLFNLLPIFPLDGGRITQAALWPRFGYVRSMRLAIRTGFIGAIALGIFGAVTLKLMIVAIAIFGGVTCWMTHRQLAFTEEMLGHENDEYALGLAYGEDEDDASEAAPARPSRAEKQAEKIARQERQEAEEVDRILQKIADRGMDSLTQSEKQLLQRVTERKRQQQ